MRIEEIVGQWIAKGRGDRTQAQIGEELGRYLGKPWSRQSVSAAEKGERAFTAAELIAFSLVLGSTVEALMEPPVGVDVVEVADGQIDSRHLRTTTATNSDLNDLVAAVHELRQRWPQVRSTLDEIDDLFETAVREVWRAARGRGIDVAQEQADVRNAERREKRARWRADLGLPSRDEA